MQPDCFEQKTKQAEDERIEKMEAEIAAAKKGASDDKKGGVLDLDKLTWRDFQRFESYRPIDNPEECESCPRRAIGKFWNGRTEPVCIDVKCFKTKEKACRDKEAAKDREEAIKLTERVKVACDQLSDEVTAPKIITDYLLSHSRKDTRERFARMYGIPYRGIPDLSGYITLDVEVDIIQKIVALVLTLERYEGVPGLFNKMLADLEGTGDEVEKQIAAFREKHCKNCTYDKGECKNLMRVYLEGKCYAYWKKSSKDEEDDVEDEQELLALPETEAQPADPLAELIIHTATDGEKQHCFKLGETEVRGNTIRGCILALGKHMGWGSTAATILENLRNLPASQNSELLIGILEGDDA